MQEAKRLYTVTVMQYEAAVNVIYLVRQGRRHGFKIGREQNA